MRISALHAYKLKKRLNAFVINVNSKNNNTIIDIIYCIKIIENN